MKPETPKDFVEVVGPNRLRFFVAQFNRVHEVAEPSIRGVSEVGFRVSYVSVEGEGRSFHLGLPRAHVLAARACARDRARLSEALQFKLRFDNDDLDPEPPNEKGRE